MPRKKTHIHKALEEEKQTQVIKTRGAPGDQRIFIEIANNNFGYLVKPKKSMEEMAERLMRLKAKAEIDYKKTQSNLIRILDDIVKKGKLRDSKELRYFIEPRERLSLTYSVENGRLIRKDSPGWIAYPNWFKKLVLDLIDFLSGPQSNTRRIKKCPICKSYFIAKDSKREYCYPPKDCEKIRKREFNRDFMKKKRNKQGPNFDPKYI